jgi:hypothetical protein
MDMMKMKKIVCSIIFLLIIVNVFTVTANNTISAKNENQQEEICSLNNYKNSENEESKSLPISYGFILGRTRGRFDFQIWTVRFANLEFENRTTRSGFFGFFIIGFLEIGKTYEIKSSKEGYIDDFQEVTLTKEKPIQWIDFIMWVDEW